MDFVDFVERLGKWEGIETVGELEKEVYNLKTTCSRTGFSAFDLH